MNTKNRLLMVGLLLVVLGTVSFSSSRVLGTVLTVAAVGVLIGSVLVGARQKR